MYLTILDSYLMYCERTSKLSKLRVADSISNGLTGGIPKSSSPLFKVSLKHSEASLIKLSKTRGANSLIALQTKPISYQFHVNIIPKITYLP